MINDILTQEQRIRLECLAQALQDSMRKPPPSAESIIDVAKRFEKYVAGSDETTD